MNQSESRRRFCTLIGRYESCSYNQKHSLHPILRVLEQNMTRTDLVSCPHPVQTYTVSGKEVNNVLTNSEVFFHLNILRYAEQTFKCSLKTA